MKKQAILSEFYLPFFTPLKLFRIDSNLASFPLCLRGVVPFMVQNSVCSLDFKLPNYGTSLCPLFHLYLMSSTSPMPINILSHSQLKNPPLNSYPSLALFSFFCMVCFLREQPVVSFICPSAQFGHLYHHCTETTLVKITSDFKNVKSST